MSHGSMTPEQLAALGIRPPPQNVIDLSIANAVIAGIFFVICAYIVWRHGKSGMVTWPLLLSAFPMQMVAGIYLVVNKDDLMIPNAVTTMTNAGVLACISLTLIGCVYQCNTMLPTKNKHRKQMAMLAGTHLFNTGGIGVATYAGAPDSTAEGGVINKKLNGIGNLIMLWVLFTVIGWMWPTFKRIRRYSALGHPNAAPARWLLFAAGAAMPFWLIRLAWWITYAFDHMPRLDPITGTFAVKLLLSFGTYFLASICLLVGGWFGVRKAEPGSIDEYGGLGDECGLQGSSSANNMEMMRRKV